MGIRRLLVAAMLASSGMVQAQNPCAAGTALIARAGAGHLGSAGPFVESLPFQLKGPGRVWAEADGLRGLDPEDRDAAPEVFLDDTYLGPLLADDGEHWRSPQALLLGSGRHWLVVRSAQEGAGPALKWSALRVLGDAPCPPARRHGVKRRPLARGTCAHPAERGDWPSRLGKRPLILSAPDGKLASSGSLVLLRPGDVWKALMKIPKGSDGQALPLLVRFEAPRPAYARFLVWVDRRAHNQSQVDALGYHPDVWEPLSLTLCGGNLALHFAQESTLTLACKDPTLSFEIAAQDMDLRLAPFTH